MRAAGGGTHYAVANGAEGEPATFKDRTLMRADPYRIIEGLAIAAFCVDAPAAYIGVKRSFGTEVANLRRATVELGEAGLLGELAISIVEGPDEYLFGEEKALLEVIEGRDPLPRLLPPWQHGLFATVTMGWEAGTPAGAGQASNPTLVNNVETLAAAAHILARGATWYRSFGTPDSAGHRDRDDRRRRSCSWRPRGRAGHAAERGDRPVRRRRAESVVEGGVLRRLQSGSAGECV